MKKTRKPLSLNPETVRALTDDEVKRAAGGVTLVCPSQGYTVCVCQTDYPNSCPCQQTAQCEPSYRICG